MSKANSYAFLGVLAVSPPYKSLCQRVEGWLERRVERPVDGVALVIGSYRLWIGIDRAGRGDGSGDGRGDIGIDPPADTAQQRRAEGRTFLHPHARNGRVKNIRLHLPPEGTARAST